MRHIDPGARVALAVVVHETAPPTSGTARRIFALEFPVRRSERLSAYNYQLKIRVTDCTL